MRRRRVCLPARSQTAASSVQKVPTAPSLACALSMGSASKARSTTAAQSAAPRTASILVIQSPQAARCTPAAWSTTWRAARSRQAAALSTSTARALSSTMQAASSAPATSAMARFTRMPQQATSRSTTKQPVLSMRALAIRVQAIQPRRQQRAPAISSPTLAAS